MITPRIILLAAITGAVCLAATPAPADDPAWTPGPMGPGMMGGYGPGMGYGPGGYGYGPGMGSGMGPGMGYGPGQGMMGGYGHPGYGPGHMMGYGPGMMNGGYGQPCPGAAAGSGKDLTEADVKKSLEARLRWMGNDRLKVGKVATKDDSIVADVVTKDGSLVDRYAVDPKTGVWQRVE